MPAQFPFTSALQALPSSHSVNNKNLIGVINKRGAVRDQSVRSLCSEFRIAHLKLNCCLDTDCRQLQSWITVGRKIGDTVNGAQINVCDQVTGSGVYVCVCVNVRAHVHMMCCTSERRYVLL